MAITRTTIAGSVTAFYNFMLEHAVPAYFDRVELSEDGTTVLCYVGELAFLSVAPADLGGAGFTFTSRAGMTLTKLTSTSSGYNKIGYAWACAGGLAFSLNYTDYSAFQAAPVLFITKDTNGDTACVYSRSASSAAPSTATVVGVNDAESNEYSLKSVEHNATVLYPLPLWAEYNQQSGLAVLEKVQWMAFRQVQAESAWGILTHSGVECLSNGLFVLKDE